MGLYLTVFEGDDELDGVEVGSYADFNMFRDQVVNLLEGGNAGDRFPVLILHSDCDGHWSPEDCVPLEQELKVVCNEMKNLPPIGLMDDWQRSVARSLGLKPTNLNECFFDIDGEPLIERIIGLAQLAQRKGKAILFQ